MFMLSSLALVLFSSPAQASDGSSGYGIYQVDPTLTRGTVEFFLEIYVNADEFPTQVDPVTAKGEDKGDLHIQNMTSGPQIIYVNDVKVGRLGPLTTATIHQMKSGSYKVTATANNGFAFDVMVDTVDPTETQMDPTEGRAPAEIMPSGMPRAPQVAGPQVQRAPALEPEKGDASGKRR